MNFFHTQFVPFLYYESVSSHYNTYRNETQRSMKTLFVTLTKSIQTVARTTLPRRTTAINPNDRRHRNIGLIRH
ncbi:hypothetical protein [Tannerella sp.]|uniref:hypothetical protein n=1 Tax=Tannerella sp. TaxID=2382127 RepID=UPI0026DAE317|nr:hypothetical protein [Tannerella sp.]MDO4702345.1 hypothetical protein [Tannerella sp.]